MSARWHYSWDRLRSSYWFVPLAAALGAVVLARGIVALDGIVPDGAIENSPFVYVAGADSERATLLTIATTTLGTAGIVFSLAAVPLSVAASQYGSRLLRNFLRDIPTQAALGAFCGTFAYCLTTLFSLPPEGKDVTNLPHLAVTGALGLALLCFVALVFFVHHVGASLQAPIVIDEVADDLEKALSAHHGHGRTLPCGPLDATETGYVQAIDFAALIEAAARANTTLTLTVGPGSYIGAGEALAQGSDTLGPAVQRAMVIGSQRIPTQDIGFGILQLVEVAVRAMSPAINDPLTAINCLERLGVLLARISREGAPAAERRDSGGVVRVSWPAPTLEQLTETAFSLIRQYGRGCTEVLIALLGALERLSDAGAPELAAHHAALVVSDAKDGLPNPTDIARVEAYAARFFR
jgi:uncharacterized membrane protein